MRYKDKPWFDDQSRHAFGLKPGAHLRWTRDRSRVNWEEFVCCQVRANETYSEAKSQFTDRNRDVLMNVHSAHKWWSTLKSAVFCSSSSFPPLVSEEGELVCESVGKADLLSDHFDFLAVTAPTLLLRKGWVLASPTVPFTTSVPVTNKVE